MNKLFVNIATSAVALAVPQIASAKSADQLHCLHEGMVDNDFIAFAELVTVDNPQRRTRPEPDFIKAGMRMSSCARRYSWTENERNNSIGYSMAYPVSQGLRILGERQGYAALDRYFAKNPTAFMRQGKLELSVYGPAIDSAIADGLTLDATQDARDLAARYLDSLYQVAKYQRDFEADKFKMPQVQ
jgi:hypothetical protein